MEPSPVRPSAEPRLSNRKERRLILILAAVGMFLIVVFGLRAVRSYPRLRQIHINQDTASVEMVRGWMTVEYISSIYNIPEEVLFAAMNIPAQGNASRSLAELNRRYYPGQRGLLIDLVIDAISAYQVEHGLPPPLPTQFPPAPPLPGLPILPAP